MADRIRQIRWFGGFAALLVLAAAPAARAGGAIIYHTGEDVFEVASVTDEIIGLAADKLIAEGVASVEEALKEEYGPLKLGYRCASVFGLFWAYWWWKDCEPVVYQWTGDKEFEYLPMDLAKYESHMKTQASDGDELKLRVSIHGSIIAAFEEKAGGKKLADAYPLSSAKIGFWKKNGRWFMGGAVLILLGLFVWSKFRAKAATPPPGAFPPPGAGFPPQGGGFPPQGGGFPPQGGGFPPQGGG